MHTLLFLGIITTSSAFLGPFRNLFDEDCASHQFTCNNKHCIPMKLRCNDKDDCRDGSDEKNCEEYLCQEPDYFRCNNTRCIAKIFVCDKENDCGDYSDEKNCEDFKISEHVNSTCDAGFWKCTDKLCIPDEWVCDGEAHCLDESDEGIGCSRHIKCDTFKCKNGHCIPNEWICDGNDDCHDKSDEEDCENHVPIAECNLDNGKFLCANNKTCIDRHKVCDGHANCPDKSDESTLCTLVTSSCQTHGCSHQCVQLPTGPKCICPEGYHSLDEKRCEDINECEQYGICDQKCRNTPGSYECYCDKKYILQEDKKTCKISTGEVLMIFSSQTEIRGLHLETEVYVPLASNQNHVVGVDYDGEYIYWTEIVSEQESIVRSDGTKEEILLTSGLGTPEDLAVDWLTGNIYFTDVQYTHIGVCTKDASYCTVLVNKDIRRPRAIVLDIDNGKMYWTDWGKPAAIGTSFMDGSNDEAFVKTDLDWPNGLTIDVPNQRLYWTDAKKMSIESIRLDGTDRRIVLDGIVMHPYAIAIFEDRLYWSDWHTKSIETCKKFTGKEHHTVVREERELVLYGIHIYHPAMHQRADNPCALALCSDICLLKGTKGYTCACPQNKILNADGHTCRESASKNFILVGGKNMLYHVEHQLLGRHDITSLPTVVEDIGCLAFDSVHNVVFISDLMNRKIASLNLYTGSSKTLDINGLGKVISMDYDAMGNSIYLCDEEKQILEVVSLNTLARKVLLHDMDNEIPECITLVPQEGVMFVALRDKEKNKAHIDRFNMDGTGRIHTKIENLSGPMSMHFDSDLLRIFIADATRGVIESTSLEGDDRHEFRTLSTNPVGITTLKEQLFWVNENSKRLYWADKKLADTFNKKITLELPDDIKKLHIVSISSETLTTNQCSVNNNNCTHLCLMSQKAIVCACPIGWHLQKDMHTCIQRIHCQTNEFFCQRSNLCIPKSSRCNKHKDCQYGEDEDDCETQQKCSNGYFQCHNGDCIDNKLVCNHNFDCKDKSDEHDCSKHPGKFMCSAKEFRCENDKCISSNMECNGIDDCGDGSDEKQCEDKTCSDTQFRCDSGTCIPKNWECDHEFDCPDYSDEHSSCASVTCPSTSFTCSNGKCIDRLMICDDIDDCGDNSDEQTCFIKTLGKCKLDEQPCPSNLSVCVHHSAYCNGMKDCPKGEDEENCTSCDEAEYTCTNKKCIPYAWVCDGIDDCMDRSDEQENCNKNNGTVLTTMKAITYETCENGFRCKTGQCIEQSTVCDGKSDCYDGSDEGGHCAEACAIRQHHCTQNCHSTPIGPTCSCEPGFQLKGDGFTCVDENECNDEPAVCSQICHNQEGSYNCECYDGFLLRNDKKSCKAEGDPMSLIFIANGQIRELTQKTNNLSIIYSLPMPRISGMDVSVSPKYIYFSMEHPPSIHQINLDTRKRNYLMNKDIGQPQKVTVDWSTHNVYYYNAENGEKSIKICNFKDVSCMKLIDIDNHKHLTAMAIDSVNKLLFYCLNNWHMFNSPTFALYKANLDGSQSQVLVNARIGYITGLTFDFNKKSLYYMDEHRGNIGTLSYEGKQTTIIYSNINQAVGLKFFENHLYYFTNGGFMMRCKLYERSRCNSFRIHSYSSSQFAILQKSLQPEIENVCLNHTCSSICVPSGFSYKCLCDHGIVKHKDDKCEGSSSTEELHVQSEPLDKSKTEGHSGTVALAILIPIFLIFIGLSAFYVIKKKNTGRLSLSMRYYNPAYNENATDDEKPILQPGLHEYTNPVHQKDSNDSELTIDVSKIMRTE